MSDIREGAIELATNASARGHSKLWFLDELAATESNAGDAMVALRRGYGIDLAEAKGLVMTHPRWALTPELSRAIDEAVDQMFGTSDER